MPQGQQAIRGHRKPPAVNRSWGTIAIQPKPDPPSHSWWLVPPEKFHAAHVQQLPRMLAIRVSYGKPQAEIE